MITSTDQLKKGNLYKFHYKSIDRKPNIWGVAYEGWEEYKGWELSEDGRHCFLLFGSWEVRIDPFDRLNFNVEELVTESSVPHVCWITFH